MSRSASTRTGWENRSAAMPPSRTAAGPSRSARTRWWSAAGQASSASCGNAFATDRPSVAELMAGPVGQSSHRHWAEELEVVVVGVGEGRDRRAGLAFELVGRGDHDCSGALQALEVARDVLGLEVPDQPARGCVLALDLGVRPDHDEARAQLPPRVCAIREARLAEDPGGVLDQPLGILGPDEYAVEVHRCLQSAAVPPSGSGYRLDPTSFWHVVVPAGLAAAAGYTYSPEVGPGMTVDGPRLSPAARPS